MMEPGESLSEDCARLLEYISTYPTFYFRPTRLARHFNRSSQQMSKMLLKLYKQGFLTRIKRSTGHSVYVAYKICKDRCGSHKIITSLSVYLSVTDDKE